MSATKTISAEIIIKASKERVWEILTSFSDYSTWNPFIISSRGEAIPGTRLDNVMMNGRRKMTFHPKVLRSEPYRYFDWLGNFIVKGLFDGHHYFRIDDLENGMVRLTQGENFSGMMSGIILKSIESDTLRGFERMNEALKQRAEAG
ncbi:MAG: hypothetical protein JWQ98_20 [Chlorobi bacterium]|nr:hypothetical protein [Chlorobiota bacterium]